MISGLRKQQRQFPTSPQRRWRRRRWRRRQERRRRWEDGWRRRQKRRRQRRQDRRRRRRRGRRRSSAVPVLVPQHEHSRRLVLAAAAEYASKNPTSDTLDTIIYVNTSYDTIYLQRQIALKFTLTELDEIIGQNILTNFLRQIWFGQ